jgi:hypothetical protein
MWHMKIIWSVVGLLWWAAEIAVMYDVNFERRILDIVGNRYSFIITFVSSVALFS